MFARGFSELLVNLQVNKLLKKFVVRSKPLLLCFPMRKGNLGRLSHYFHSGAEGLLFEVYTIYKGTVIG